jgi:hypothetical protein
MSGLLLCFCVGCFGEPFDRGKPPVPLGGEVGHGPGGLVEAAGAQIDLFGVPWLISGVEPPVTQIGGWRLP